MPPIVEPPQSPWEFSAPATTGGSDLVAVGADLAPGTILAAYRAGMFPMGVGPDGAPPIGWWCPDPRGVLRPGDVRVSRSLRRSSSRLEVTIDERFADVVTACADPSREGRWITSDIRDAYVELHCLGWAHSVEVWSDGELVGGLYGLALGGLFAGESMFHRVTDASKVALMGLCEAVRDDGDPARLIDVQWLTPHLGSLGAIEMSRADYLRVLPSATACAPPAALTRSPRGPAGREHRDAPQR